MKFFLVTLVILLGILACSFAEKKVEKRKIEVAAKNKKVVSSAYSRIAAAFNGEMEVEEKNLRSESALPMYSSGLLTIKYFDSYYCDGKPFVTYGIPLNTCMQLGNKNYGMYTCNGNKAYLSKYSDSSCTTLVKTKHKKLAKCNDESGYTYSYGDSYGSYYDVGYLMKCTTSTDFTSQLMNGKTYYTYTQYSNDDCTGNAEFYVGWRYGQCDVMDSLMYKNGMYYYYYDGSCDASGGYESGTAMTGCDAYGNYGAWVTGSN
jgi:hypothetical protein